MTPVADLGETTGPARVQWTSRPRRHTLMLVTDFLA